MYFGRRVYKQICPAPLSLPAAAQWRTDTAKKTKHTHTKQPSRCSSGNLTAASDKGPLSWYEPLSGRLRPAPISPDSLLFGGGEAGKEEEEVYETLFAKSTIRLFIQLIYGEEPPQDASEPFSHIEA